MQSLPNFDLGAFAETLAALAVAFVFGGAIGLERQIRQRNAGLRTMVLVSVGAAAFVDLGGRLMGPEGRVQMAAYVVSGIGFLGAGVIMKEGVQVRGLNTAATLWASAAVGAFAGSQLFAEAAAVTVAVLAGNTLLRPLVDYINRRPIDAETTEAHYEVRVFCAPSDVGDARDLLAAELEAQNYPIASIETETETEEQVELTASLIPTSANADELDAICIALERHPIIENATWTVEAVL
ncbi:MAG TPA: MgtC/SapB family protein [Caulobacteraceae bacterium]|jgi:putative Mg2+ transporter-C (MgtC) family protein